MMLREGAGTPSADLVKVAECDRVRVTLTQPDRVALFKLNEQLGKETFTVLDAPDGTWLEVGPFIGLFALPSFIASDENDEVRSAIARHPRTPLSALQQLAMDRAGGSGRFCQVNFLRRWWGQGGLTIQAARSTASFQV